MPIRIAIVDDHPIVLDGLEQLFKVQDDMVVTARCQNADQALALLRSDPPEILVLDLLMPGSGGLDLLRAIGNMPALPTRVVVLTAVADDDQLLEAIRLGAQGIVLKDTAPGTLTNAIRQIHAGAQWYEQGLGGRALRRLLERGVETREPTLRSLSAREREIVRKVARGLKNRAIAAELSISEGTVKVHLHNVYEKLDVGTRLELANYLREHGWF